MTKKEVTVGCDWMKHLRISIIRVRCKWLGLIGMLHAKIMIINFMFHSMNRKNINKILIAFYPYMNIASSDIE
jgi:hypothetical protein